MDLSARCALVARRQEARTIPIRVVGVDLSDASLRMQVRRGADMPGAPLIQLAKVTADGAQGIRLASVGIEDGRPVSHLMVTIAKATMSNAAQVPYPAKAGADMTLAYALQIAGITRLEGPFVVRPAVIDSDASPQGRAIGGQDTQLGLSNGLTLTLSDGAVELTIDGGDLVAQQVREATEARQGAKIAQAEAGASAASASLSAVTAAGFIKGIMYPSVAAGLAALPADGFFTVAGDEASTYATLYRKVGSAAVEQSRYASKAAYEGASGACLIGTRRVTAGSVLRTVGSVLGELPVSVADFGAIGDGVANDSPAFNAWLAYIRGNDRKGYIPTGRYRLTAPQIWRPRTTGFPTHSLTIMGESEDGVILIFDYADAAPCLEINPPYDITDAAGYTGLEGGYIGGFTIEEAPGQYHQSLLRIYNTFSTVIENIRVRPDGRSPTGRTGEYSSEYVRVTSGCQWLILRNVIVDPYNVGMPANPYGQQSYYGIGFSIGNGYRDGPKTNQYAISSNKLYGCRAYHCHIGCLTEAADATTLYDPVMVQNDRNYVDRAALSTLCINPWDEGATIAGLQFDAAVVEDSTGVAMRKTAYPQVIGGYMGRVMLSGVVGAAITASMNRLEVTVQAQRCHALVLGQDSVVVMDDGTDSKIQYFRTTDNRHVQTIGAFENSFETPSGSKLLTLSDAKGVGIVVKNGITPTVPGEIVHQRLSDTQVNLRMMGMDGVVRTSTTPITFA